MYGGASFVLEKVKVKQNGKPAGPCSGTALSGI